MEMSKVIQCEVADCAYNADDMCHARAITVGDMANPRCDTYCMSSTKCSDMSCTACVGACKTAVCMFNDGLECDSSEVSVGYSENGVNCLTFAPK